MLDLKFELDTKEDKLEVLKELYESSNYSYIEKTEITHILWDFNNDLSIFSIPYKNKNVCIDLYGLNALLHNLEFCKGMDDIRNKLSDRDIFILRILNLCTINNYLNEKSDISGKFGFYLNRNNKDLADYKVLSLTEYFKYHCDICSEYGALLLPYNFFTNIEEEYNSFKNTLL